MGTVCSYDKPSERSSQKSGKFSIEEQVLKLHEEICPLYHQKISKIKQIFSTEANREKLTFIQLKKTLGMLNFPKEDLEKPEHAYYLFMLSFNSEENYSALEIYISCILVSNSKVFEKLKILFELFDKEKTRLLSKQNFEEMFKIMCQVSTYNILFLAYGISDNCFDLSAITAYSNKFSHKIKQVVDEITLCLFISQIEIGECAFYDFFTKDGHQTLTNPSGLRTFLLSN